MDKSCLIQSSIGKRHEVGSKPNKPATTCKNNPALGGCYALREHAPKLLVNHAQLTQSLPQFAVPTGSMPMTALFQTTLSAK